MKILFALVAMLSGFGISTAFALPPIYPAEDVTMGGVGEAMATETINCLCKGVTQNTLYYIGDVGPNDADYYYSITYDCVEYIANAYAASVFQTGFFNGVSHANDIIANPANLIVKKNNKYYCSIPLKVSRTISRSGPAPVDCNSFSYDQSIPNITVPGNPNFLAQVSHTIITPDVRMECSAVTYP